MKANKKALALVLCALMLVAASVFGTLAYLVDTDNKVTNTFTVGNVVITLDEADVDEDGVVIPGANPPRVYENEYKLMPGHNYVKDPAVHIDSASEDCYVFVKITNEIKDIESTEAGVDNIAAQMKANGWYLVNGQTDVYYYGDSTDASIVNAATVNAATPPYLTVFEEFTIKGDIDTTVLSKYAGKTIKIIAYAIQADGFSAEAGLTVAEKAWTALSNQMTH